MDFYKDSEKRVLIFSLAYIPFVGGAELAVKEITERINSFNFDLITLRFDRKWAKQEKIGNVNVYRIGGGKMLFPFLAFFKGLSLNRKRKYDLVWSIMANRAGFASLFFKLWNPKAKYLLTLQEGDALNYPEKRMGFAGIFIGGLFRKIFTKADHIQAISNYLADWARKMGAIAPIVVVPNGVDAKKLKTKNEKLKTDEKIIITTSRLVYKNGVDVLIKAIPDVKHFVSNIELWVLGGGLEEKKLKELAKDLGVENIVKFFGHIEPENIYGYLAQVDIFVRASRTEGLGSSFLEAMGAGLPIVGTAVGGIPDFLKDNETGLFCQIDNPKDLAEKIKILMTDELLAKRISENGRQLVLKKYNWNNIAKQMQNLLSHIITIANLGDSKNANMKILICTGIYPPDIGGPATYSKLLFDELPKRGVEIDVLSFSEFRHLPKIIRHFFYFFKALRMGKKADVFFAQDPVSVGLPAMMASKILGKKFVLKLVGDYAWEQFQAKKNNAKFITPEEFQDKKFDLKTETRRRIQIYVAKSAKRVIVPSNYLKNIVLKWGVVEEKIKVIYNAFDLPTLSAGRSILEETKEELRKKLGLSGTVLISAGRLVVWKGFDVLIEVMPEILKAVPDAKLYIIGSGPETANYKNQIANSKLEDKVFMIGQVSRDDMLKYLNAGDVFVLNTGYEGFSHFLLEAMAMGIPIITTSVGGNTELIENGKDGILIDYNDKEELKKKIIEIAGNEALKNELTKNAKQMVIKFSKEKMLEETVKILKK